MEGLNPLGARPLRPRGRVSAGQAHAGLPTLQVQAQTKEEGE